jgi:hypothetical protein
LVEADHLRCGADARGRSVDLVFGAEVRLVGHEANEMLADWLLFALTAVTR